MDIASGNIIRYAGQYYYLDHWFLDEYGEWVF